MPNQNLITLIFPKFQYFSQNKIHFNLPIFCSILQQSFPTPKFFAHSPPQSEPVQQLFDPEFPEVEKELSFAFHNLSLDLSENTDLEIGLKEGNKTPPPFAQSFGQALSPGLGKFNSNPQQRKKKHSTTSTISAHYVDKCYYAKTWFQGCTEVDI